MPESAAMAIQPGDLLGWYDEAGVVGYEEANTHWACLEEGGQKPAKGAAITGTPKKPHAFNDYSVEVCYGKKMR